MPRRSASVVFALISICTKYSEDMLAASASAFLVVQPREVTLISWKFVNCRLHRHNQSNAPHILLSTGRTWQGGELQCAAHRWTGLFFGCIRQPESILNYDPLSTSIITDGTCPPGWPQNAWPNMDSLDSIVPINSFSSHKQKYVRRSLSSLFRCFRLGAHFFYFTHTHTYTAAASRISKFDRTRTRILGARNQCGSDGPAWRLFRGECSCFAWSGRWERSYEWHIAWMRLDNTIM